MPKFLVLFKMAVSLKRVAKDRLEILPFLSNKVLNTGLGASFLAMHLFPKR